MDPSSWQIQRRVSAALNAIKQNSLTKKWCKLARTSYLKKYDQSSYKNSKALDEVTQNMDESSSNINILPGTVAFYLALHMGLRSAMRMTMLMKSEAHPVSK